MSDSILGRIEAHQLKIIEGQQQIVEAVGGLRARVDKHDVRIGALERKLRILLWLAPPALILASMAGAWVALRF